jgi:hypothetical protein
MITYVGQVSRCRVYSTVGFGKEGGGREGDRRWEKEEQTQELPDATGNNKNNTNNNSTVYIHINVKQEEYIEVFHRPEESQS